jgi:hypothetical protein
MGAVLTWECPWAAAARSGQHLARDELDRSYVWVRYVYSCRPTGVDTLTGMNTAGHIYHADLFHR